MMRRCSQSVEDTGDHARSSAREQPCGAGAANRRSCAASASTSRVGGGRGAGSGLDPLPQPGAPAGRCAPNLLDRGKSAGFALACVRACFRACARVDT